MSKVSVFKSRNSVFLRWTHNKSRYSLSVGKSSVENLQKADNIRFIIEKDLFLEKNDLEKYKKLIQVTESTKISSSETHSSSFLTLFHNYVAITGNMTNKLNKLYITLQMLRSFDEDVSPEDIPRLMKSRNYKPTTFNERLGCLRRVTNYLVKTKKLEYNPFLDIPSMKRSFRNLTPERMPLSITETNLILNTLKSNVYHRNTNQYYPFVKFMFMTGVRNAEAIGLTVEKIDFLNKTILINQSFARTDKGSCISARVMKGTKMDNARYLPLSKELNELLLPLVQNRKYTDFVFINRNKNPIDDHQFQKRVWNPMLYHLNIPKRDLYAIRHTFGTRCSEQGMNPKDIQYLMGHADIRVTLDIYVNLSNRVNNLPSMF